MNPFVLAAKEISDEIVRWRRQLHTFPEVGLDLPQTKRFVIDALNRMNVSYREYDGHSGIVACIGNGKKTVALRADMDALPMQEESGVPYASTNGNMHACGHDAHVAILLGVAQILKQQEKKLKGRVVLIFQPNEEGAGGAKRMIADGALNNVDCILALHVGNIAGEFPVGHIAVRYGPVFASCEQVKISVTGKGGHASVPSRCVDAFAVSTLISNTLQYVVSREISPQEGAVLSVTSIKTETEGISNIIPNSTTMYGDLRCELSSSRSFLHDRIRKIAELTAEMMRATAIIDFDGFPPLLNNRRIVDIFLKSAKKIVPDDNIHVLDRGIFGGEDAAFFFEQVPGCYFFLANAAPCLIDGKIYGHHHPKFCIDDSTLWLGTALLCQAVGELIENDTY